MYFLGDVSPIHNFHQQFLHQKNRPGRLAISYHCADLVLIFEVDASVYLVPSIFMNNDSDTLGRCIT